MLPLFDSLKYAQVCIRLDIVFAVNALGRYLSDLGLGHWKAVKRSLGICREPRITCWPIKRMINFNIKSLVVLILILLVALTIENLLPVLVLWSKEKVFLGRGLNKLLQQLLKAVCCLLWSTCQIVWPKICFLTFKLLKVFLGYS